MARQRESKQAKEGAEEVKSGAGAAEGAPAGLRVVRLPVGRLRANAWNPNTMTREQKAELLEEVRRAGRVPRPVAVWRLAGGVYEILDGEHGWEAAKGAGLAEVDCEVVEADDFEAMRLTWVRNEHGTRDPLRTGRLLRQMQQMRRVGPGSPEASQRQLAREINIGEGTLRNHLLYAEAAEVRNRYAPDTADETIRGTPVARLRLYLRLPADRRDEWLDREGTSAEADGILAEAARKSRAATSPVEPGQPVAPRTPEDHAGNLAGAGDPAEAIDEPARAEGEVGEGGDWPGGAPAVAGREPAAIPGDGEPARTDVPDDPPEPAGPLSPGERVVVDAVMRFYREARTPVRHKILAGLAAEPDAVAFFRRMIKQGS